MAKQKSDAQFPQQVEAICVLDHTDVANQQAILCLGVKVVVPMATYLRFRGQPAVMVDIAGLSVVCRSGDHEKR